MRKGEIKVFAGLFTPGSKKLGKKRVRSMRIIGRYGNIWISRSGNNVALYIPAGSFDEYRFPVAQAQQWGNSQGL